MEDEGMTAKGQYREGENGIGNQVNENEEDVDEEVKEDEETHEEIAKEDEGKKTEDGEGTYEEDNETGTDAQEIIAKNEGATENGERENLITVKIIFLVAISCSFGVGRITEPDTRVGREMVFGEGETAIETWKITKEKSCEVCLDVMVTPVQFAATAPLMYFIIRRLLSFIIGPRHFSSSLFSFVFLHFLECFSEFHQGFTRMKLNRLRQNSCAERISIRNHIGDRTEMIQTERLRRIRTKNALGRERREIEAAV